MGVSFSLGRRSSSSSSSMTARARPLTRADWLALQLPSYIEGESERDTVSARGFHANAEIFARVMNGIDAREKTRGVGVSLAQEGRGAGGAVNVDCLALRCAPGAA